MARGRESFPFFIRKSWNFIKCMKLSENHEILWKYMKFMTFIEILCFWQSGGSKTLIFLRNYRCFWHACVFAKEAKFQEFNGNHRKSEFCVFLPDFTKTSIFCEKRLRGRPGTSKSLKFHYVYKHLSAVAARVRKCENGIGNVNWFYDFPLN